MDNAKAENRQKLFELLSKFSVDTVCGMISRVYKSPKFGYKYLCGDGLLTIVLPPLEEYFNQCAYLIESKTDPFINEKFAAMMALDVTAEGNNPSHPMDLLQIIVLLSLSILQENSIPNIAQKEREYSALMYQIRASLTKAIYPGDPQKLDLHGCPKSHIHLPIDVGEKIFSFSTDKFVEVDGKPVKMSTLNDFHHW